MFGNIWIRFRNLFQRPFVKSRIFRQFKKATEDPKISDREMEYWLKKVLTHIFYYRRNPLYCYGEVIALLERVRPRLAVKVLQLLSRQQSFPKTKMIS